MSDNTTKSAKADKPWLVMWHTQMMVPIFSLVTSGSDELKDRKRENNEANAFSSPNNPASKESSEQISANRFEITDLKTLQRT
jgi:hypothetical protein